MRSRNVVVGTLGVTLVVVGTLLWNTRLNYSPEQVLDMKISEKLVEIEPDKITDLTGACTQVGNGGWLLFVLEAQLTSDSEFRTFFETAEERSGLWVEYDPGLLRLGLGLGPNASESNTEIPIRWVRRDEKAVIAIVVRQQETIVVTNAKRQAKQWRGPIDGFWKCNAVQVGSDTQELTQGHECENCRIRLRFAYGDNGQEVLDVVEKLDNIAEFNLKRWLGSGLLISGILLLVFCRSSIPTTRKR